MRKLTKVLISIFLILLLFAYNREVVADGTSQFQLSGTATSLLNNWNFCSNIRNDQVNAPFEWWLWEAAKYGVSDGSVAAYGVKDGYAFIKIAASGSDTWHIQFNQWVKLKQKQYYMISFKAKADQPRTINVKILMNHDPWVNYFAQTVELTKEWKTYTFYYKHPDKADETVNFCFELGKGEVTTVYIADVILRPVDESEVPEEFKEEEPETVEYEFEDEEEPDNLVNDGDFAYRIINDQASMPFEWWIWQASTYNISPAKVEKYGVVDGIGFIKVENPGHETWHIQFNQWVKLRRGNSYVISFKAKADTPRKIWVKLVQTGAPYGVYFAQEVELTTEWKIFTFEHAHPKDGDPVVTLSFELGKDVPTTVYFDDITISPKK
ncbi:carbohydrate binding domain-containing protein [Fervidobacterium islandicum]|uniref:carbohydrate binding domain-containing protein n=1 Tax=Fervidobacterium islandicum TaxID=2423 RepID=UPI003A6983AB